MILLEDAVRGEDKKQVNWFKDTETNGYWTVARTVDYTSREFNFGEAVI